LTVSLANTKSRDDAGVAASGEGVRLTITGVDVKGLMFRHSATVLMLEGRDCVFRSKSQPELNGSVLLEFEFPEIDPKRRLSQGLVKSSHADVDGDFYEVAVELEVAQPVKVARNRNEPKPAVKQSAPPTIHVSGVEGKGDPVIATSDSRLPPNSISTAQALPRPSQETSAPTKFESRELLPKTQLAEDPAAAREALKSAVASEMKQQIQVMRSWISSELEKVVPAIVSSSMEKMIRESVEKQISADRQAIIQAVHSDVAREVGGRIAESDDLRSAVESMAQKVFEQQTELSRSAGAKVEQELGSRTGSILRSFEDSVAEMEARLTVARIDMEAVLAKTQTLKQEIEERMSPLQETLEQLRHAETSGIEKFQRQTAAQMDLGGAQFENQLSRISGEKAAQFATEMEAVLTRTQSLKREIEDGMRPLQETLEQLNLAERTGIERFQSQAAAQMSMGGTQFEQQIARISGERATHFAMEMEEHLAPHRQRADESMEKLGAVLQLLQGTARVQQERLTEHSQAAAANFEKEIRALLLRLAGGA
jgi:hypothetical protein